MAAKGFIPKSVKEKTTPFRGLYLLAWRYPTYYIKFEGPNDSNAMWKNVRYYVFHGTVEEKDQIITRLKKANAKEGRSFKYAKRVHDLEADE